MSFSPIDVDVISPNSGKFLKDNNTIYNIADGIQGIAAAIGAGGSVIFAATNTTTQTYNTFGTGTKVSIINNGSETITLTVGAIVVTVFPNTASEETYDDFTAVTVTVPSSSSFAIVIVG